MLRRIIPLFVCLGIYSVQCAVWSQSVVEPSGPEHLRTISFSVAVMQTNEAKRDFEVLEKKFAPRQRDLQSLSSEIDELRKQINDLRARLSDSELNARTQTLAAKQKQLERAEEDYRNDSQSDGEQAFRRIGQKVFDFLQTYARDHGYTMVIDRGNENIPVVLFATPKADITNEVVSAYNAKAEIAAPMPKGSNSSPLSQPR